MPLFERGPALYPLSHMLVPIMLSKSCRYEDTCDPLIGQSNLPNLAKYVLYQWSADQNLAVNLDYKFYFNGSSTHYVEHYNACLEPVSEFVKASVDSKDLRNNLCGEPKIFME